jgi:monovalent cation:proton antiporter-2 (CPA2) family protein
MTDSVLAMAFVYLVAAVVCVPVAKRVGLGAVLGYLVGGILIGPFVLGFVGHEHHSVGHFAEFGVVMMLFVVGLELRPALLWQLRKPIFGLGGAQVLATLVVVAGAALALGIEWRIAIAIGAIFSASSTAIVLSTLAERGLLKTQGGQASFSVLLFQDISVIPILAVLPLLATLPAVTPVATDGGRPAWQTALLLLAAVAGIVLSGRFIVRPLFQFLAMVKVRESFTAAALLIVVAIALVMQQIGLSPALGTFLAGVVLADSEYRHELETDIEPFKGLLLGLFFISIGAQIDFGLIASDPLTIGAIVLATMAGKLAVLYALGRLFGLDRPSRWLLAFSLAQVGEFAFVLLQFGVSERVFSADFAAPLVAVVALSMGLTPLLFIALERFVLPRVAAPDAEQRPQDTIEESGDAPVIIAGYGRFGQMVGRILRANRIKHVILDLDPEMVDVVARLGVKVYYGDASRMDLLHAAGCEHAKLFVCAVDVKEEATNIVENVRHHYPHLKVIARARDRQHYWELRKLGCVQVFRETFGSAYEAGIAALIQIGYRANTAHRLARRWRDHEEKILEDLGQHWGTQDYFARTKLAMEEAERLMRDEDPVVFTERDAAWDNESLRADRQVDAAAAKPAEPS